MNSLNKLARRLATFVAVPVLLTSTVARSDAPKAPEKKPEAVKDLGSIGLSLLQYAEDADHALPPMTDNNTVAKITWPYHHDNSDFFNSETGQKYQPNTSLSNKKLDSLESGIVLFYEPVASSDNKRWVLMLLPKDGNDYDYSKGDWVRQINEEDWPKLKKASGIQ